MVDKSKVEAWVGEWLAGKDYFLVDVKVSPDERIVVEIDHADGVWMEDCADLSRFIGEKLESAQEDYELEVGSAGIGQPFKVKEQYAAHVGKEVEVLTAEGKKLRGVLTGAGDDGFELAVKVKRKEEGEKRAKTVDETMALRYDEVKYTKYIIRFK